MNHPRQLALEKCIDAILPTLPEKIQHETATFLENYKKYGIQMYWNASTILVLFQEWIRYGHIDLIKAVCDCRLSPADDVLSFLSNVYNGMQDEIAIGLTPLLYDIYTCAAQDEKNSVKNHALPYLWEYCLTHNPKEADVILNRIDQWPTPVLHRAIQHCPEKIFFQTSNILAHALQRPILHEIIRQRWSFQDCRALFTKYAIEWPIQMQWVYTKYATWQIVLWRDSPNDGSLNEILQHIIPQTFDEQILIWICQVKMMHARVVAEKIRAIAHRRKSIECKLYDTWIHSGLSNAQWIDAIGKGDIIPDTHTLWRLRTQTIPSLDCSDL